jgi:S-DNA-T family DNA segregation ATPase FtsK/SpoIIIE
VDWQGAWNKIGSDSKSAGRVSATVARNSLDSVSLTLAPVAARWNSEADRRKALRTPENLKRLMDAQRAHNSARSTSAAAKSQRRVARASTRNPLAGTRRAARTADRAASKFAESTKSDVKAARTNYPATLASVVARIHAAHATAAGLASWALTEHAHALTLWPAELSVATVAAQVGALYLGRRQVTVQIEDGVSAEERRLLERLNPTHWVQHAEERGLSGTLTETPEVTAAGIVCGVRLDGKWSAKELASKSDSVRALLGMKSETRLQISRGSHGDRAQIVIRTRSASDGVSMIWTPDHVGIGVDEVTGEFVDLPLRAGVHVLLAGRTGMGKSVSWRPLVMRAVMNDAWTAMVIDPKRQEAIGWQHTLRCIGQETDREERMERIYGMAKELTGEMHRRQGMATGATWAPDGRPENRNLLVVVDEGAAIVRMSKQKQFSDVLDLFEELWSEARSVGFQFVWATQFPTKSVGVPAAVKENMSAFMSLTVNPGEAERAIFGETAQQAGWLPSRLDGIPGRAMLQFGKRSSDPLRLWHVTDGMVAGLPNTAPWYSPWSADPAAPAESARPALRLVKDYELAPPGAKPAAAVPAPRSETEQAVLDAVRAAGAPVRQKDLVSATGLAKGTVSKAVARLADAGALVRAEDGSLTVAAGEVSA